jgi:hypothetical protein
VNPQTYDFGTEQEAIYAWNERHWTYGSMPFWYLVLIVFSIWKNFWCRSGRGAFHFSILKYFSQKYYPLTAGC